MKTILIALAIVLGGIGTLAQEANKQNSDASARSADLAEADRLSESVIKLYGERKFDEALPRAKRVLELREKALPSDDPATVAAVVNLAEIQFARGKPYDAQSLFERALKSTERNSGPESRKVSGILDRLAIVNYALGNPEKTEGYYRRSLAVREKVFSPEHEEVAHSLYNLAEFYQFQGDYKKAEPLYQRLVDIRKKNGESQPSSFGEALERYSCLLRKTKRQDEADQLEYQAMLVTHVGMVPSRLVSAGVINGKAVHLVTPPYPEEARQTRQSGKVTVRVVIDESGRVLRACAVEGPGLLMKASESAAYRSTFTPTTVEGMPVKVRGVIIYNFVHQ
jgi:TonB family protein